MSPTAIAIVAVVGVVAAVALVLLVRGLVRARRAARLAQDLLDAAETELAETTARMNAAEIKAGKALTRASNERDRATKADRDRLAAEARIEEIEAASRRTERDLRARLVDPIPFSGLEAVRVGRLWQLHAPMPGEALPGDPTDDVHAAVVVLAEASREETGTAVTVSWTVRETPPPAVALAIVRTAEELIASAREAETAELDLTSDATGVIRMRLETDPPLELSPLLADALGATGWLESTAAGLTMLRFGAAEPRRSTDSSPSTTAPHPHG